MNNKGLNNGLLAGLIGIIVLLISYFLDQGFYLKYASWVVYVVYVYFMYMAGKQTRDEMGGYLSFGQAFLPIFITFAVGSLLVSIFQYFMVNFIDVSLLDAMQDQAIEQIDKMSGLLGEEGTEAAIEKIEEDGVSLGIGQVVLGWIFGLIFGAIISAIMGAIVKKEDKSGV